jgi:Bacterial Ig-like domain
MKRFLAAMFALGLMACQDNPVDQSKKPVPNPALDITAPALVSRAPANAATNVKLTDEISLTFNEAILPSSITAASVQVKNGATVLARTATLDASGKKLVVILNPAPALPATITVSINGLTDLAGNTAVVADSSFTIPTLSTAQTVEVVVLPTTGNGTTLKLQVLMRNFSGSRARSVTIYLNGKFFDFETSATNNGCPPVYCFVTERPGLTSYDNGTYNVTALVRQDDETETSTTVGVPVTINVKNFDGSPGLGWSPAGIAAIERPAYYKNLRPEFYASAFQFYSVNTGTGGATTLEVFKQYSYAATPRSATSGFFFRAIIGSTSVNDAVQVSARDCKNAQTCTVWNDRIIDSSNPQTTEIGIGPPNFGDTASEAAYMEIRLRFVSVDPQSKAYIGNIFVGSY